MKKSALKKEIRKLRTSNDRLIHNLTREQKISDGGTLLLWQALCKIDDLLHVIDDLESEAVYVDGALNAIADTRDEWHDAHRALSSHLAAYLPGDEDATLLSERLSDLAEYVGLHVDMHADVFGSA